MHGNNGPVFFSFIYLALFAAFVASAVYIARLWRKPTSVHKKMLITLVILVILGTASWAVYYLASWAISILELR